MLFNISEVMMQCDDDTEPDDITNFPSRIFLPTGGGVRVAFSDQKKNEIMTTTTAEETGDAKDGDDAVGAPHLATVAEAVVASGMCLLDSDEMKASSGPIEAGPRSEIGGAGEGVKEEDKTGSIDCNDDGDASSSIEIAEITEEVKSERSEARTLRAMDVETRCLAGLRKLKDALGNDREAGDLTGNALVEGRGDAESQRGQVAQLEEVVGLEKGTLEGRTKDNLLRMSGTITENILEESMNQIVHSTWLEKELRTKNGETTTTTEYERSMSLDKGNGVVEETEMGQSSRLSDEQAKLMVVDYKHRLHVAMGRQRQLEEANEELSRRCQGLNAVNLDGLLPHPDKWSHRRYGEECSPRQFEKLQKDFTLLLDDHKRLQKKLTEQKEQDGHVAEDEVENQHTEEMINIVQNVDDNQTELLRIENDELLEDFEDLRVEHQSLLEENERLRRRIVVAQDRDNDVREQFETLQREFALLLQDYRKLKGENASQLSISNKREEEEIGNQMQPGEIFVEQNYDEDREHSVTAQYKHGINVILLRESQLRAENKELRERIMSLKADLEKIQENVEEDSGDLENRTVQKQLNMLQMEYKVLMEEHHQLKEDRGQQAGENGPVASAQAESEEANKKISIQLQSEYIDIIIALREGNQALADRVSAAKYDAQASEQRVQELEVECRGLREQLAAIVPALKRMQAMEEVVMDPDVEGLRQLAREYGVLKEKYRMLESNESEMLRGVFDLLDDRGSSGGQGRGMDLLLDPGKDDASSIPKICPCLSGETGETGESESSGHTLDGLRVRIHAEYDYRAATMPQTVLSGPQSPTLSEFSSTEEGTMDGKENMFRPKVGDMTSTIEALLKERNALTSLVPRPVLMEMK